MKKPGPTGWRGVMNQRPSPSDFGLSPLADNVDSITQRQRVRLPRISHGIGGGMRVHDDTDILLRIPAPRQPAAWSERKLSLTGPRALFGVYAAMLVALLLIGHVHLRFTIHDMNMQQHSLQSLQRNLQRQSNQLDQAIGLVDLGSMRRYAVDDLNMVPNEDSNTQLMVSASVKDKYSETSIAQERKDRQEERLALGQSSTARRFWKLADMAWTFAEAGHR